MNELFRGIVASGVYALAASTAVVVFRRGRRRSELALIRRRLEILHDQYDRRWIYSRGVFDVLGDQLLWLSGQLRLAAVIESQEDLELLYFYLRRACLNVEHCAQFNTRITDQVSMLATSTTYLDATQRDALERLSMGAQAVHSQLETHAEACTHFLRIYSAAVEHMRNRASVDPEFDCTTYKVHLSFGKSITGGLYARRVACNFLEAAAQFAHLFQLWAIRHETLYAPLGRVHASCVTFGHDLAGGIEFDWQDLNLGALEDFLVDPPEGLAVAHITLSVH